jgi:Uma2 family endonuclease
MQHAAAEPIRSRAPTFSTWEQFVELEEDDPRELLDGALVETEVPGKKHETIVGILLGVLYAWVRVHKAGELYPSGYKVRVSKTRGVMPDVQFYRADNPADRREEGCVSGRPDLAIEVVSPKRRRYDRVLKLSYYAAIGVPEYWIIDPEDRTLEQLVFRDGRYAIEAIFQDADYFRPASFEDLEISLAEFWPEEVAPIMPTPESEAVEELGDPFGPP